MDKIGIIISGFQSDPIIEDCLDSLSKVKKDNFEIEIIVVDDKTDQKKLSKLKKKYPYYLFLPIEKNIGFAAINNIGIKEMIRKDCNFFCLINNDTIVHRDFIQNLYRCYQSEIKAGIISPKIYFAPGYEFHSGYKSDETGKVIWYAGGQIDWKNVHASHEGVNEIDKGQFAKIKKTDFVSGCCMFFSKKTFDLVGEFEEKYFMYFEDIDYSLRVLKKGMKVMYCPRSIIWHKNAGSSGGAGKAFSYYFQERNRYIFGLKYASARIKFSLIKQAVQNLASPDRIKKLSAADFLTCKSGKGSLNKL